MTKPHENTHPDWPALLERIKAELESLSAAEKSWIKARLAVIETVQLALDELFCKAGGIESCTSCDGACCDCGRHHVTLTNLLGYLLQNQDPPAPDFSQACPYLGAEGCRLPVSRRPYNCITFFCDRLDGRLDPAEAFRLQALDQQLRAEYEHLAERCPGASLRGLWIAVARLGDKPLLRQAAAMVE